MTTPNMSGDNTVKPLLTKIMYNPNFKSRQNIRNLCKIPVDSETIVWLEVCSNLVLKQILM
jgi:hypothetical protein